MEKGDYGMILRVSGKGWSVGARGAKGAMVGSLQMNVGGHRITLTHPSYPLFSSSTFPSTNPLSHCSIFYSLSLPTHLIHPRNPLTLINPLYTLPLPSIPSSSSIIIFSPFPPWTHHSAYLIMPPSPPCDPSYIH